VTDLKQNSGKLDLTMQLGDDLSFDADFGIDLTNYDFTANIIPSGTALTIIPIVITETDLSIGKLHFFISKDSIESLPIASEKYKWEFVWNTPKQEITPITVYTRTILAGNFNILGV